MSLRLLPVMMAAVALMLTLRAAELWHQAGAAFAQSAKPADEAPQPAPAKGAATAPSAGPTLTPEAAAAKAADPSGISEYTEAELAVLQDLASRREELDRRAAEMGRREAILKAAEQRIEAKVQELKTLQAGMEAVVRRYDEEEEARKKSLVKIFETMKPAEAARIFEQMDLPILLDLIERMKERNAAPVLAQMHPVRAKQVTAELARRRQPGVPPAAAPNG